MWSDDIAGELPELLPRRVPGEALDKAMAEHPAPPVRPLLTWRQAKALRFIRAHITKHGYPPSMRETGDAVGLASTSSVQYVLSQLVAKGYITRDAGKQRAIRIQDGSEGGPA